MSKTDSRHVPGPVYRVGTVLRVEQAARVKRVVANVAGMLRRAGVNRPAFFSLLARGTQSAAALVSVVFVARFLGVEAQGFYYTILGFVAFVQLSDFGLAYAVMQSASHETSLVALTAATTATVHDAQRRIRALLRGATLFNAAVTLVAIGVVAAIGTAVLRSGNPRVASSAVDWRGAWILVLATTGATQLLAPRIAILEGSGHAASVWQLRLRQELVAGAVLWVSLAFGLQLWSIGTSGAARFLVGFRWVRSSREPGDSVADSRRLPTGAYWWVEVWPFQWRIGLSLLAGFLIFQIFTPIIFSVRGPLAAARFGMTLAIVNGLLSVSTAWLNSQAPRFGQLIASRAYRQLDREFARALKSSSVVVVALAAFVVCGAALLAHVGHPFSARLLPVVPFLILIATAVVNHVITGLAVYLRAHRREPLLWPSLLGAVLTPPTLYVTARYGTTVWIAGGYLLLTLVGLAIAVVVFVSRANEWRAAALVAPRSNDFEST